MPKKKPVKSLRGRTEACANVKCSSCKAECKDRKDSNAGKKEEQNAE
jgi:hypothetical protein